MGWQQILEKGPKGRLAYLLLDEPNLYYADPFGVAFSPHGRYLYISSSGADVVSVLDMEKMYAALKVQDEKIGIADETVRLYARHLALSSEYVVARIPTECNPKGLVVSPDGRWVYVANRLSDSITLIDAERQEAVGTIDLGGPKVVTTLRQGERLFNYASISFQKQLSCNTCHPENHLDGLVYDIAIDGIGRNWVDNRTMRGIAETAPFKWSGKNPTLYRQEGPRAAQLFFRSHGFEKDENEAVVRFIKSIRLPKSRYLSPDGKLNEFQKRGRELFERAYTNDLVEYMKALSPEVQPLVAQTHSSYTKLEIGDLDSLEVPNAKYVGNQVCKGCHAEAYRIWVASKHARSYVVLHTMMAKKMGEECKIQAYCPQKSTLQLCGGVEEDGAFDENEQA